MFQYKSEDVLSLIAMVLFLNATWEALIFPLAFILSLALSMMVKALVQGIKSRRRLARLRKERAGRKVVDTAKPFRSVVDNFEPFSFDAEEFEKEQVHLARLAEQQARQIKFERATRSASQRKSEKVAVQSAPVLDF